MGMSTRLYPLPDGDKTKLWYPLGLDMEIRINLFYGDGYGIIKLVPTLPRYHP